MCGILQESQRSIAEKVPIGETSYKHRRDIVFSQAVTTVVTSAVFKLLQGLVNKLFVAQLVEIGFLCHWESLLSTIGSEYGMLEDFIVAIHDLNNMKLKVLLPFVLAWESLMALCPTCSYTMVFCSKGSPLMSHLIVHHAF